MPDDPFLSGFYEYASGCDKLTLVVWAYEYSEKYVGLFGEYSDDSRVAAAREASFAWAKGLIKMPEARRYILAAHAAARESGSETGEAAGRAVAQAASTVHSARHAFGLVLYGLTALAKKYGKDSAEVMQEKDRLYRGLIKIAEEKRFKEESWAPFLVRKPK